MAHLDQTNLSPGERGVRMEREGSWGLGDLRESKSVPKVKLPGQGNRVKQFYEIGNFADETRGVYYQCARTFQTVILRFLYVSHNGV